MNGNPVAWFEIYVQDIERAKGFYQKVFDVTLEQLESPTVGPEYWAFPAEMSSYGAAGALVKMDGCASGGNSTLVYFQCQDCAVEEGRVAGAGGEVHRTKTSIGEYGYISLVIDSEGNMIGLHSMQ